MVFEKTSYLWTLLLRILGVTSPFFKFHTFSGHGSAEQPLHIWCCTWFPMTIHITDEIRKLNPFHPQPVPHLKMCSVLYLRNRMALISDLQSPICGADTATHGSESHISGIIWLDIAMTATRLGRCYGYLRHNLEGACAPYI
jgi:hypothetical protein